MPKQSEQWVFKPGERSFQRLVTDTVSMQRAWKGRKGTTTSPFSCTVLCFSRKCTKAAVSEPVNKGQSSTIALKPSVHLASGHNYYHTGNAFSS